jgi:hypothetical protein
MTRQYKAAAAAGRARNAAEKTADFWTRGTRTATDAVPGLPRVDLVPAVERYFELVQWTVDINRRLAVKCAEAVGTLSGVVREKAESAGDLVREKAEAAGNVMLEQAEKAQQTALEQAEKAEQAEKTLARQARQRAEKAAREQAEQAEQAEKAAREQAEQAEKALALQARQADREQARRAHKRARERYEGRTKAELSDELARRELPKTGNVDELIERLVEADSK